VYNAATRERLHTRAVKGDSLLPYICDIGATILAYSVKDTKRPFAQVYDANDGELRPLSDPLPVAIAELYYAGHTVPCLQALITHKRNVLLHVYPYAKGSVSFEVPGTCAVEYSGLVYVCVDNALAVYDLEGKRVADTMLPFKALSVSATALELVVAGTMSVAVLHRPTLELLLDMYCMPSAAHTPLLSSPFARVSAHAREILFEGSGDVYAARMGHTWDRATVQVLQPDGTLTADTASMADVCELAAAQCGVQPYAVRATVSGASGTALTALCRWRAFHCCGTRNGSCLRPSALPTARWRSTARS
jgi:hypothetical protein